MTARRRTQRLRKLEPNSLHTAELSARVLTARGRLDEAAAVLEAAYAARAAAPEGPSVARTVIGMLTIPPMKQLEAAERVARKFAETTPRPLLPR